MTIGSRVIVASCAIGVAAVFAAGCGSSSKQTSTTPPSSTNAPTTNTTTNVPTTNAPTTTTLKDPCSYVTVAEVRNATGIAVTASKRINDFGCTYSAGATGTVNVGVAGPTTRATVESDLKAETAAGTLPPSLAGLGDAAYQTLGGVAVVKGTESIRITMFSSGTYASAGNAGAVGLARLILGRV
jgi:hypothetical protein